MRQRKGNEKDQYPHPFGLKRELKKEKAVKTDGEVVMFRFLHLTKIIIITIKN
jgi:hypothetical protein